jgi:hypothetical protein
MGEAHDGAAVEERGAENGVEEDGVGEGLFEPDFDALSGLDFEGVDDWEDEGCACF